MGYLHVLWVCQLLLFLICMIANSDSSKSIFHSPPNLTIRTKDRTETPDSESILQEIRANQSEEIILIDFTTPDFNHITSIIDFRKETQILHVIITGEVERGDPPLQEFCFGILKPNLDMLSPSAVVRLRQKNPESIKWAEEDKGIDQKEFIFAYSAEAAGKMFTPMAEHLCSNSPLGVLLSQTDYEILKSTPHDSNGEDDVGVNDVQQLQLSESERIECSSLPSSQIRKQCLCDLRFCIPWYPCGWKLCKKKGEDGEEESTFRCGIRSCRICHKFSFPVTQKLNCMWNS